MSYFMRSFNFIHCVNEWQLFAYDFTACLCHESGASFDNLINTMANAHISVYIHTCKSRNFWMRTAIKMSSDLRMINLQQNKKEGIDRGITYKSNLSLY